MVNVDLLYETFRLYLGKAVQFEKSSNYSAGRRYYYLAAEQMLKIAQENTGELQKTQYKRAKDIIAKADNLPVPSRSEKTGRAETVRVIKGEKVSLSEALQSLNEMEGLSGVKRQIEEWTDQIKVFRMREEKGMPVPEMSYHLVFTGNPGTGKTTVARIIAQIYCALGILSNGQLVEVSRSDLVAGYVGQTALKTQTAIEKAFGGVLFIDEAYSLAELGGNDFGKEAISTLLKEMEDRRDNLVVIAAGYEKEMRQFISSNSGLKSRFKNFIKFEDYSDRELFNIFLKKSGKDGYIIEKSAQEKLMRYFETIVSVTDNDFGNGRGVRNLYEKIVSKQSQRISQIQNPTLEQLSSIKEEDVEKVISLNKQI